MNLFLKIEKMVLLIVRQEAVTNAAFDFHRKKMANVDL
jgi:hypothetical protein